MKKLFFLFIVLIFAKTNAQNISGIITYDEDFMYSAIDTSQVRDDYVKSVLVKQMKGVKKALAPERALYVLSFNNTESLFKPIPIMASDNNPFLKLAVSENMYYKNLEEGKDYKQIEIFGKTYRIFRENKNREWYITDKSKYIQGYLCYYATTKVKNSSGSTTIEAWFTPEIPLNFGPKGYSGLPGLILGLKELGRYMHAKEIKLSKKNVDIAPLTKGKLISEKEFDQKIHKAMGKLSN